MGKRKERAKQLLKDKQFEQTEHYSKRYAATVISIASAVICILAVVGAILLKDYFSAENLDKLQAFVAEHWFVGALIFMAVCAIQVIIALIPGEAVEIAAGVIFGSWAGALVCLIGIMTGSVIVILLVRKFGRKFVESLYPREKIDSLPILNDPKKRNAVIALLFFIPGTPKDLITYIVGLTEVSIPMYILLTTVARIPSIIMSTFGGDAFGEGKILKAIIIFGATAIISGIGYLAYMVIQKKMNKKHNEEKADQ
ncbi:MAG: TVP38/TMEM64 family protein [Ruminococcaceae bacterium]|nr:TVP38/TMEM64 family protein [Oscillospiraceae bacterium]